MCISAVPIVVDNCGKMKMRARSSLGVQIRVMPYGEPSRMSLPNCGMTDRLLAPVSVPRPSNVIVGEADQYRKRIRVSALAFVLRRFGVFQARIR
jgi:hypothetical protein